MWGHLLGEHTLIRVASWACVTFAAYVYLQDSQFNDVTLAYNDTHISLCSRYVRIMLEYNDITWSQDLNIYTSPQRSCNSYTSHDSISPTFDVTLTYDVCASFEYIGLTSAQYFRDIMRLSDPKPFMRCCDIFFGRTNAITRPQWFQWAHLNLLITYSVHVNFLLK
jgi:hypothetical protein